MCKLKLSAIAIAASLTLSACGGDDDNDDVVAALEQQNQILQDQMAVDDSNINAAPINFFGSIYNTSTDSQASQATIKIKVGNTWREPIVSPDGNFEINDLPAGSDYEMLISSDDGAFMDRAIFGITPNSSGDVILRDIGNIAVAAAKNLTFKVLNANTSENISDLEFSYSYFDIRDGSSARNASTYENTSTYDSQTGDYTLAIADFSSARVMTVLDVDNDGEANYSENENWSSGMYWHAYASEIEDSAEISFFEVAAEIDINHTDVELRVAVIDENGVPIESLELTVNDVLNSNLTSSYDAVTEQHVLAAKLDRELYILVPAFSHNDIEYTSSYITVRDYNAEFYSVNVYGSNNQGSSYAIPKTSNIVDVVIQPRKGQDSTSNLDILFTTDELDKVDHSFRVFFSQPVELNEDSVSIELRNSITVTAGNEDPNDLVLPGVTFFSSGNETIDVDASLSVNDTLLTLKPSTAVESGNYFYNISEIISSRNGLTRFFNNRYTFQVKDNSSFNINDVILDNGNYTTNGAAIVSHNTAGEVSSASNQRRSALLLFPSSVESLKNFTLMQKVVTANGVETNSSRIYTIVKDGHINIGKEYYYPVAQNEAIDSTGYFSFKRGFTVNGGHYYNVSASTYLYDHEVSNENKVTYEYSYESQDGEVTTGTIELNVL